MPEYLEPAVERVILIGFMGAGKSTVGRLLAAQLGWTFADLDTVVEQRTSRTVPEIFASEGETAFRLAETQALQALLTQAKLVIALGGGALGTPALRALLEGVTGTFVVHLHAPFPVLYERCQAQALDPLATARPLLQTQAAAEVRYTQRLPLYAAMAHLDVNVSGEGPDAIVQRLLRLAPLRQ